MGLPGPINPRHVMTQSITKAHVSDTCGNVVDLWHGSHLRGLDVQPRANCAFVMKKKLSLIILTDMK